MREVAGLVLEHVPRWMAEMRSALEAGQWRDLKRLAHTLKTSTDNIGAREGVAAAALLERLADERDADIARPALADLEAQVARLLPAVSQLLGAPLPVSE